MKRLARYQTLRISGTYLTLNGSRNFGSKIVNLYHERTTEAMNKITKKPNPWMIKSSKTPTIYPKIALNGQVGITRKSMNFDKNLLKLGASNKTPNKESLEV